MRPKRLTPPVRRTARRWRTPPAITTGAENFEGMAVLDEIGGPLGFLLWQAARDVVLWAGFTPEERVGLFEPGADALLHGLIRSAGVEVQLESPLMTIVRMVGGPDTARAETVELACQHIAHWADGHGYTAAAIAYAQAAALTVPYDAGAAYAVGRVARRRAEYARAETWFRRAIALARQSGDWTSYALAFSGLGNLYMQRGNYPSARRFHVRALRAARRHSLRAIQGSALHDLFVIAAAGNHKEDAERYARGAFESYGPEHPRLPALANDIAYFWVERGHFAPALTVFEALLPHMTRHEDRLVALANIVRAAAGAGERRQFEQTWDEVWDGLARDDGTENAAQVLLELAHGAAQLGEFERAERAAERAVKTARDRGQARTLLGAESVLDSVRRGRGARGRAAAEAPRPEAPQETEMFATDLVRSLNASLVTR
ncbi:tetratricopeptide repeat protein [Longimicrobium sp.]|uniref:tetratricopeptide repeat protein n=1 Tax=Longimicrobium sp. TaxID=2029185 RepID=UPI002BAE2476|nr:tetratricopeptide repeat protein [Longimicrobium sp.]HSU17215.1 tetratricopeptide repeat protein [Longimicrobium sp.]